MSEISKEVKTKDTQLLKYLNDLETKKIVEQVLVNIKSSKDVDVIVKVQKGMLTSSMVKIESDMYCKPTLDVEGVFRNLNTLRVLTKQSHTYYITILESESD